MLALAGAKDTTADVTAAQPALFEIDRPAGPLPYGIRLDTSVTPTTLDWFPRYRMEGTLAAGSCRALGAPLPPVVMTATNGKTIRPESAGPEDNRGTGDSTLKPLISEPQASRPSAPRRRRPPVLGPVQRPGTKATRPRVAGRSGNRDLSVLSPVVLDFWASWCVHCLVHFDEPETAGAARKILAGRHLPWTQVLLFGGQMDPVWQILRSMGGGHGTPFYVPIDPDNIVRYPGSGRQDLQELRTVVEKWKPRGQKR